MSEHISHRSIKNEQFYPPEMTDKQRSWREIRIKELRKQETPKPPEADHKGNKGS